MSVITKKKLMNIPPASYASAAVLAQAIGQEMLTRLDFVTLKPAVVVDLGCGTGQFAAALAERYPEATVIALDVDYPMLQFAQLQAVKTTGICADAAVLPFADQSVDLLFANLLLPWCDDLEKLFREWRRVLRTDGLLVFTSLGPDTLREWRDELGNFMLPNFVDMHEVGDVLTRTKFAEPVMDMEYYSLTYRSTQDFIRELYESGMLVTTDISLNNVEVDFSKGDLLAANFEIVYGHAWGPDVMVDQVADAMGVINIPLGRLRRR
jgi:malonyl-CoA O-methyltransferase